MQAVVIVVVVLQLVFLALLTRRVRAVLAGEEGGAQRREARLLELYGRVEELMDVFESYVGEARRDIEKQRAALSAVSARLPARPESPRIVRPAAAPRTPHAAPLTPGDREALARLSAMPQKARFLLSRGLPPEEAARALGIGVGEVRLIAELEQ